MYLLLNITLSTTSVASHSSSIFGIFIQFYVFFKLSLRLMLSPMYCIRLYWLISKCLEIFLLPFCYWFLVWFHCGHINHIQCVFCYFGVDYSININYIILIYGFLTPFIFLLIFSLVIPLEENGVLKSSTIIVNVFTCAFSSINFCFIYFEASCLLHIHFRLLYLLGKLILLSLCNIFHYNNFICFDVHFIWC